MATLSSSLAWRILWTDDWQATVHGVAKSQTLTYGEEVVYTSR